MKTVLIYSGGLDSTVLLYDLLASGDAVIALSFDYGQKHRRELEHARKICIHRDVKHRIADLHAVHGMFGDSALTSGETPVPEGHYEAESMKATVVPNRNMILISIAAAWAISLEADRVAYAAQRGDHAIYPDCRHEFVDAMNCLLYSANWKRVLLSAPFVKLTKSEIVARGEQLGVPFAMTWSCYRGGKVHCGKCGTCNERREAFVMAKVADQTVYEE